MNLFSRLFGSPVAADAAHPHPPTNGADEIAGSRRETVGPAVCCFCNSPGAYREMFSIGISPPGQDGSECVQGLVSHGACLDKALHPEIWRHPALYA